MIIGNSLDAYYLPEVNCGCNLCEKKFSVKDTFFSYRSNDNKFILICENCLAGFWSALTQDLEKMPSVLYGEYLHFKNRKIRIQSVLKAGGFI